MLQPASRSVGAISTTCSEIRSTPARQDTRAVRQQGAQRGAANDLEAGDVTGIMFEEAGDRLTLPSFRNGGRHCCYYASSEGGRVRTT
jgi:hypothetical protein